MIEVLEEPLGCIFGGLVRHWKFRDLAYWRCTSVHFKLENIGWMRFEHLNAYLRQLNVDSNWLSAIVHIWRYWEQFGYIGRYKNIFKLNMTWLEWIKYPNVYSIGHT